MRQTSQPALEKALQINLDQTIYGTFAEIGAGQEIARFFFQAGKASQTVAKTMSAYDMVFSDEIYGKEANGRYVCESRLEKMLKKEFDLLQRRLGPTRGANTRFFSLADTVATAQGSRKISNGWIGIRYQKSPEAPSNDIVLHVRLLDRYRLLQQEALGILGVNLVYSAFFAEKSHKPFIDTLTQGIRQGQIAIDYLRVSGPDMEGLNEQLLNLELLLRGYNDIVLFGATGKVQSLPDAVFNQTLVIERGSFRPSRVSHVELLKQGEAQITSDFRTDQPPMKVLEINLTNLKKEGEINEQAFLEKMASIKAAGLPVLVSSFDLLYRLKRHLRQYTQAPVGIIVSAHFLPKIFEPSRYSDLEGGLLEGLGKLLDGNTKIYVYPSKDESATQSAASYSPPAELAQIYAHFRNQNQIIDLSLP